MPIPIQRDLYREYLNVYGNGDVASIHRYAIDHGAVYKSNERGRQLRSARRSLILMAENGEVGRSNNIFFKLD